MHNEARSEAKKPLTRTFAPKVRSGCLTCKIRRKKCDVEKPTCHRCRVGQFVCDGYGQTLPEVDYRHKSVIAIAQHHNPRLVLNSRTLPGNTLQQYFVHHFFTHAVNDLEDLPYSSSFWDSVLITLNQHVSYIQPAIAALGATHWLYLTGMDQRGVSNFVINQYDLAINDLAPVLSHMRSPDLPMVITACLLFVCIESLRGNSAVALRHLKAGSRIILDPISRSIKTDPNFQQLAAIFHALGNQVALFSCNPLFPDTAPHLLSELDDNIARPFRSYYEANDNLSKLDGRFNRLGWNESSRCENLTDGWCGCPDGCLCLCCQDWNEFKGLVLEFETRLQPLLKSLEASDCPKDRQHFLRLRLQEKVWKWIIGSHQNGEYQDLDESTADEILTLIERVLKLSAVRPTFSLTIDLIPNLVFVYECCPAMAPRLKCIELLRTSLRREVLFKGDQTAALLEDHMRKLQLSDGADEDADVFPILSRALLE